jgi:hypothetical protein
MIGTPEEIAAARESYTGQYLKQVLKRRPSRQDAASCRGSGVSSSSES